jgi:putative ABC transport system permease protein
MLLELKYAWRLLKKNWGYSLLSACVVALSVGLSGWASVVAYSQLFKSLGFPGSERWYSVQIATDAASQAQPAVDAYTYQELLKRNRSADHLGAYASQAAVLSEGQASTTLRAAAITPRLLAATQVAPHLGRVFEDSDRQSGAARVAILSFDSWQTYFAADPAIIGKTARIDAAPVRIIGVMPQDFFALQDFEVWFPLDLPQLAAPRDSSVMLTPLIVLGKNQNVDSIRNEMKAIVSAVNRDDADLFNPGRHLELFPARVMFSHAQTPILGLLIFLAGAILLLGCLNVSMVFLSRLLERSRELAMRSAVGASRGRLLRQCLIESALILPPALIAGYGIASLILRWGDGMYRFTAQILGQGRTPRITVLRPVDVAVAVSTAIVIWLLSTLIPAWRLARQDVAMVLAGSGKGTAGSGATRSARFLVGLEVVIASLVLVVAGGMVVAVKLELSKRTGLNTANVMMTTYATTFDGRYAEPANRLRYWDDLTAAIKSRIPGAEVAFATAAPSMPSKATAAIETQEGADRQGTLRLRTSTVSESYFPMLGMSLRSGRLFDSTDNRDSLPVAIVDEKMAARYWPGQNALGKRLQLKTDDRGTWLTIVGIVSSVQGQPYVRDEGVVYQSLRQAVPSQFRLLVRLPPAASGDSRAAVRAAAFSVDRDVPLRNLQMFDDYLAAVNLGYTGIIPAFIVVSCLTALLAASGVFGLISRSVVQRTQEVGIRRALGATPWRATSRFMRQGAIYLGVSVVGVALGLLVTNGISGTITNVLDNVLLIMLGVVLLLSAVIFAASYLPSRRALSLEPGEALRYE